jgi:phosphoribosylaminoimidazole-succinocarboxamide synthase
VRDVYLLPPKAGQEGQQEAKEASEMVMVATGRQSAFDRHLASVPFKGQVLNCISLWCVRIDMNLLITRIVQHKSFLSLSSRPPSHNIIPNV